MDALRGETSNVQRSGAAQGLTQILLVMGGERLEKLLPAIFDSTKSQNPLEREGFMTVFQYLPEAYGAAFAPHLPAVVPVVSAGLADEVAAVREIALLASQEIVLRFVTSQKELLLPPLVIGMTSLSWFLFSARLSPSNDSCGI